MSVLGAAGHSGDTMDIPNHVSVDLNIEKVNDLYHKALHYTPNSELLTDQQMTDVKDIVSNDSRLKRYLTSLNVDLLDGRLIDFSQDEVLINKLNELIVYMECDLRSTFGYPGHIVRVGSCRDESRVGRVNEMDTLYVIDTDFTSNWRENEKGYVIEIGGKLVPALELIDKFANAVEISAQKWQGINPKSDLQHGGFAAPTFTGVRYNGPAVTLLFTYESKKLAKVIKDISLDMTLAFSLPPEHGLRKLISGQLSVVQKVHRGKVIPKEGVHFVPNVVNGLWMVTTAELEAALFQSLPNNSVVKQAYRFVKIISHDINEHTTIDERVSVPDVLPINTVLYEWKSMSPPKLTSWNDSFTELKNTIRYAHSFLSSRDAKEHNESVKKEVSINTAALKHVLLSEALKADKYLTHTTTFDDDVYELVVKAFSVVLRGGSTVSHALIDGTEINMFSFSKPAVLSDVLCQLKAVLKEKCRRLWLKIKPEPIPSVNQVTNENLTIMVAEYLVPIKNIPYGCAAQYLYEILLDPSRSPRRCPHVTQVQILINGLQNTCGGKVAITSDSDVMHDVVLHWRKELAQRLPNVVFLDSAVEFSTRGSTVLCYLQVYPTIQTTYICNSGIEEIYFVVEDDGTITKKTTASRVFKSPGTTAIVDTQQDAMGLPRAEDGYLIDAPFYDPTRYLPTSQKQDRHVPRIQEERCGSYSLRQHLSTNQEDSLDLDRISTMEAYKFSMFQETHPMHFTPDKEAFTPEIKAAISRIEKLTTSIRLLSRRTTYSDIFTKL